MAVPNHNLEEKNKPFHNVLYFVHDSPNFHIPPVPLIHIFHATASRSLSTSLPISPATTVTDVDSAYCPQCLSSWDAIAAFSTAKGSCVKSGAGEDDLLTVGCVSCPECEAILTLKILEEKCCRKNIAASYKKRGDDVVLGQGGQEEGAADDVYSHVCVYQCGYCHWDSTECGIYQQVHLTNDQGMFLDDVSKVDEIIAVATQQVKKQLTVALQRQERSDDFQTLQSCWTKKHNEIQKMRQRDKILTSKSIADDANDDSGVLQRTHRLYIANEVDLRVLHQDEKKIGLKQWNVEALEESVESRRKMMASHVLKSISIGDPLRHPTILKVNDNVLFDDGEYYDRFLLNVNPEQETRQQLVSTQNETAKSKLHLPIPVPLRARAERRCIRELAAGRPGILLKPKVNPLEGDTSLRYGHGQWWKKDSSAIHSIPRVDVKAVLQNPATNQYALLLKVRNPTMGPIRFTLGSAMEENFQCPSLLEVILDPLTFDKVNVNVVVPTSPISSSPSNTEQIALEPMEDAFLDVVTTKQNALDVDGWIKRADLDWSHVNSCKLLSLENDLAWVQFVTENLPIQELLDKSDETYFGIPLVMNVEISHESWESSLIQLEEKEGDEKDFVSFHLLPIWRRVATSRI